MKRYALNCSVIGATLGLCALGAWWWLGREWRAIQRIEERGGSIRVSYDSLNRKVSTRVDLSNSSCTDEDLLSLENLRGVWFVDLKNAKITDKGVQTISTIPTIVFLDLSGTDATDAIFDWLCDMPELEEVNLKNTNVTEVAAQSFYKSAGKVRVSYGASE